MDELQMPKGIEEAKQLPEEELTVENIQPGHIFCEQATEFDCICCVSAAVTGIFSLLTIVGWLINNNRLMLSLIPAFIAANVTGWSYLELKSWVGNDPNVESLYPALRAVGWLQKLVSKSEEKKSKLSPEAEQSYLDFCGIYQRPNNEDDERKIEVSYSPDTNTVTVTEKGNYYEQRAVNSTDEKKYLLLNNKYIFERLDSTTISFTAIKNGYYRNGYGDIGDPYAYYGKGDTSYEYYLNEKENETTTSTSYQVPANFSLEQGLNPSIMTRIEVPEEEQSRQYVRK